MFLNVTSTGDPCWLLNNGFSLNGAYTHGFTFAWSYYSVFVYGPSFGVKICIVTCIFYSYALIKDDVITTQIPPLVNTVERTLENASWGRYFPTWLFNHTTLWRSFQSLWGTRGRDIPSRPHVPITRAAPGPHRALQRLNSCFSFPTPVSFRKHFQEI